jgi:toxin ParE1/3/4
MKVLWADAAEKQLKAIHDFVAQTSPDYALRLVDRLTKRSLQMALFPFSGRMVPEYELNEVRELIEGSYRIIYLINEEKDQIEVLALIHISRERLEPLD